MLIKNICTMFGLKHLFPEITNALSNLICPPQNILQKIYGGHINIVFISLTFGGATLACISMLLTYALACATIVWSKDILHNNNVTTTTAARQSNIFYFQRTNVRKTLHVRLHGIVAFRSRDCGKSLAKSKKT